jgi:hypothetical protein
MELNRRILVATGLRLFFMATLAGGHAGYTQIGATPLDLHHDSCPVPVALGALVVGSLPKVDAPYSATVTTTMQTKSSDGTILRRIATTQQMRDSTGRTREERSLGCKHGPDGDGPPMTQIMIYDPAGPTIISWMVDDPKKALQVVRMNRRAPVAPPPSGATDDQEQESAVRKAMAQSGIHADDLGSKTIAGVMSDGTKTVTTVPAREGRNSEPYEIVTEVWIARDLGLTMLKIDDNPKFGRTVTEVRELKLGDPDVSLFATPVGYNQPASK